MLYLLYLPVFVIAIFRLLSNRRPSILVFSGNGGLRVLPLMPWLRTALAGVAISMFIFETSDIILDGARYSQVENLPDATKGQFSHIACTPDIDPVITELWIKGMWCYTIPEGTSYCGYERSVLNIARVCPFALLE
jgi:hypothetical protein